MLQQTMVTVKWSFSYDTTDTTTSARFAAEDMRAATQDHAHLVSQLTGQQFHHSAHHDAVDEIKDEAAAEERGQQQHTACTGVV